MGRMSVNQMLSTADEDLLAELDKGEESNHRLALQMAFNARNIQRLSGAILAASRAGRFLAWVAVAATTVGALATLVQTIKILGGQE